MGQEEETKRASEYRLAKQAFSSTATRVLTSSYRLAAPAKKAISSKQVVRCVGRSVPAGIQSGRTCIDDTDGKVVYGDAEVMERPLEIRSKGKNQSEKRARPRLGSTAEKKERSKQRQGGQREEGGGERNKLGG